MDNSQKLSLFRKGNSKEIGFVDVPIIKKEYLKLTFSKETIAKFNLDNMNTKMGPYSEHLCLNLPHAYTWDWGLPHDGLCAGLTSEFNNQNTDCNLHGHNPWNLNYEDWDL